MLILIYVLMSWIPDPRGIILSIYRALGTLCEPYLGLFRRIIPPLGMIDFSPIVAIIVLQLIVRLLGNLPYWF
ncbi:MAG: YggT family protein [Coriobacteriaceae bacterium]|nr:YggT family protein [Coriobacteriaceae bacterium]